MTLLFLPTLNAILNGTSALFLVAGYYSIRQRHVAAHKTCMLLAFTSSTFFLISYLVYHWHAGTVQFRGIGIVRVVYLSILSSHTLLAAVIVPLSLITLYRAWKARFDRHKRIARWTLPLWLYVSLTGVTVYWMLYRM